jgi:hypothetical protein
LKEKVPETFIFVTKNQRSKVSDDFIALVHH